MRPKFHWERQHEAMLEQARGERQKSQRTKQQQKQRQRAKEQRQRLLERVAKCDEQTRREFLRKIAQDRLRNM